jgi:hypothetical protein
MSVVLLVGLRRSAVECRVAAPLHLLSFSPTSMDSLAWFPPLYGSVLEDSLRPKSKVFNFWGPRVLVNIHVVLHLPGRKSSWEEARDLCKS